MRYLWFLKSGLPTPGIYIYILVVVCIVCQQKNIQTAQHRLLLALAPVIARQWTDEAFLRDRVAVKPSSVTSINSSRLAGTKKKERKEETPLSIVSTKRTHLKTLFCWTSKNRDILSFQRFPPVLDVCMAHNQQRTYASHQVPAAGHLMNIRMSSYFNNEIFF